MQCLSVEGDRAFKLMNYLFSWQVVDTADVVLEVLDARDPLGCRCPQVRLEIFLTYNLISFVNIKKNVTLGTGRHIPKKLFPGLEDQ